jgi:hypothetical protein
VRFRRAFLKAFFLGVFPVLLAAQNAAIPINRVLMEIRLGSSLNRVKRIYPPAQTWHITREPNGGVARIQLRRPDCRTFPIGVDRISLETLDDRVVRVKAVFDAVQTRKEPLEGLVAQLSGQYGEPRRIEMTYSWQDGHTLLRAFDEPLPLADRNSVELRTAIEIVDMDVYRSQRR